MPRRATSPGRRSAAVVCGCVWMCGWICHATQGVSRGLMINQFSAAHPCALWPWHDWRGGAVRRRPPLAARYGTLCGPSMCAVALAGYRKFSAPTYFSPHTGNYVRCGLGRIHSPHSHPSSLRPVGCSRPSASFQISANLAIDAQQVCAAGAGVWVRLECVGCEFSFPGAPWWAARHHA